MAVVQYPYYLFLVNATDSEQDENGNFASSDNSKEFLCRCRDEANSSGNQLKTAYGEYILYSSIVYIPQAFNGAIQEGSQIVVATDEECTNIRIEGEVKRFYRGQLNRRIWV